MEEYIVFDDVHFARGEKKIFKGIKMIVPKGKITAIMGPSGSGKTTLLKLIGGLLTPDQGSIHVDGQFVSTLGHHDLFALRKSMGMLFQSSALLTDESVFENVAYPLREHTKLPELMLRDLVSLKLEAVGLRGAIDMMPSELSGGMARRVALARAIALDPGLIMYDEPFTGLDPITMSTIVALIKKLNDALGITSVMVSHDIDETLSIADYCHIIAEGKVVVSGTPEEMRSSDSEWVQQFLKGISDGPAPFHYQSTPIAQSLGIHHD